MRKTFVLDTNVLLHNPKALFSFEENNVVIPFTVLEEIDNQKKRQDEIGRNARVVSRDLDELREISRLSEGVSLPKGGRLTIELNHAHCEKLPPGVDPTKYDNRILAVAFNLGQQRNGEVILVTKDISLRVKADAIGVKVQDYMNDKVDYDELYKGCRKIKVSQEILDRFYKNSKIGDSDLGMKPCPNEFIVLSPENNPSHGTEARWCEGKKCLLPLAYSQSSPWGIKALNREQKFALELLLNDQIKIVTLVGQAGTGKTLLALAAGLEKVLEDNHYSKMLVTRPVVPMGGDIGFLPGTKEEKLRPWMQPIYDNLEFLFQDCSVSYGMLHDLTQKGTLELEALTYIRGRSIPKQFIICDEAQNLSPHMIKTLITRVGEDTKIVLTGDPEQIDNPYLDASSNGLTYLVERVKNEEISGHVVLVKGERSRVAELGAKLL
jgi:PhoH-like ATPase